MLAALLVTSALVGAALVSAASMLRRAPLRTGQLRLAAAADATRRRIAWVCPTLGALGCLEQREEVVPPVGDDECLVAVRAIGLNYADVFMVLGLYEAFNKYLEENPGQAVPGFEFAGDIIQAGKAVTTHKVGDRVYGFTRFGAYRTSVVVREKMLQPVPKAWSYAEAASVLVQGLTAWHGLVELGAAKRNSRVLVHSAAGGVGCAALEICENLGCTSVGVVGSVDKVPFLMERYPSCTPLVRGPERQYARQLDDLGGSYDVVLESLGGQFLTAALERVAPMGRLVHFGATAAYGGSRVDGLLKWLKLVPNYLRRPLVDPGAMVPKNVALFGFNLVWLTDREEELTRELEEMLGRGGLGKRPPAVGRSFPFAELPLALDWLRSGNSVGKVVVTVEPGAGGEVG